MKNRDWGGILIKTVSLSRKGVDFVLHIQETAQTIMMVFLIAALGYLVGAVKIRSVSLGTSAIFLVALVFGHFGVALPAALQTTGLVLFMASVGLSAGRTFIANLRRHGVSYLLLCLIAAGFGSLLCAAVIRLAGVETPVAMGLMCGAYTTSPGFASAKDAFAGNGAAVAMVAAGYGVMYPVGTLGKVVFVQLVPKLLRADMDRERELIRVADAAVMQTEEKNGLLRMDAMGFFPLALVIGLGVVVGGITVPLPLIGGFALGNAGGPLLVGLLLGHFGRLGPIDMKIDKRIVEPVKEIGLILFFTVAGTEGGRQLVEILMEYGFSLLLYGLVMLMIPMVLIVVVARLLFRLPLLNSLASMTGSMTCSASLASLIQTAGTNDVVSTYAATYPIALVCMVIVMQLLAKL